jgi:uncharacterized protein (DUF305 family)
MAEATVQAGLAAGSTEVPPATRRPARWIRMLLATVTLVAAAALGAALGPALGVGGVGGLWAQPGGGPVAVGFAQDMSVHHRQAVLMAGLARDRSTDPTIRLLAFDIETNQLEQIGQMQGWLSLWNAAALPTGRYMTWMADPMPGMAGMTHGGGSGGVATMPGMASPADLDRLRAASGAQFDTLFLQLMLRHHQGGAPMARYAAQHGEMAQVRNLAEKMVVSQGAESAYMAELIAQRGAQPLPPPN